MSDKYTKRGHPSMEHLIQSLDDECNRLQMELDAMRARNESHKRKLRHATSHFWSVEGREILVGAVARHFIERMEDQNAEMLSMLSRVAELIEDYCDDHNSDSPTDVTVILPELRAAIGRAGGDS